RAEALGADLTKLVAHAADLGDLRVLLEVTLAARTRGIVTLATGPAGPLSRVVLPAAGSLLAYGHAGRPTAPSGQLPVAELAALALDGHPARAVAEHDAGRHLVDVLPALPARADEVLVQVLLAHPERPHARGEGVLLLGRDREHAGALPSAAVGWPPPREEWRKRDGIEPSSAC